MGTAAILSETLFGHTRGAVLAVLYGHIGESFYLRQLSRRTGISLGPVRKSGKSGDMIPIPSDSGCSADVPVVNLRRVPHPRHAFAFCG